MKNDINGQQLVIDNCKVNYLFSHIPSFLLPFSSFLLRLHSFFFSHSYRVARTTLHLIHLSIVLVSHGEEISFEGGSII